jgi:putative transcriptional regulator
MGPIARIAITFFAAALAACSPTSRPASRQAPLDAVIRAAPIARIAREPGVLARLISARRAPSRGPVRLGAVEPSPRPGEQSVLASGRFLIATRQLNGPFFAHTVVLLLEYKPSGALGLVINRPTNVELSQLLPELAKLGAPRHDRVFLGGPVETELVVFLIRSKDSPPGSEPVVGDVHATGSADALRQVVAEDAPASRFHAYVGYAGWGPGQLESEIARGDWYVDEANADQIFDEALDELWQRLVQEHEGVQVRAPAARDRADES